MSYGSDKELKLRLPREEVQNRLQKQVKEGEGILEVPIRDEHIYKVTEEFYSQWYDYTKDLLLKLFSTDKMEQDFIWSVRVFSLDLTFVEKVKEFHEHLHERLNVLRSILKRLDLYEEHVVTAPLPRREEGKSTHKRKVFVVHGRNEKLRADIFNFLRAIGLEPLEWTKAIVATKEASPYIDKILDAAFTEAQAVIVLLSGDDEAKLKKEFLHQSDPAYEKELTPQARPNVLFECGMAMGRHSERTVLVQSGKLRPWSDVAGRHITLLDNSAEKRHELAMKLNSTGCEIDLSGTDWMTVGDFEAISSEDVTQTRVPKPAPLPITTPEYKTWNLRMHTDQPTSEPYHIFGHMPWVQDVEKATNGRVKITVYPFQTLMKSADAWEGTKFGMADIAWIFTGYYPGQFDLSHSVTLPFMVPSGEVGSRVAWRLYQKFTEIQAQMADVKVLSVCTTEPYSILTNKKQVKTLEDLRGIKIRSIGGPCVDMIKLLGGVPITMPMPDTYLTLQRGVIDGILAPALSILAFRLYEVAKYYTYVPMVCMYFVLAMNNDVWKSMPLDIQQAIMSVSGETQARRYGGEVFDKAHKELPEIARAAGYEISEYAVPKEELDRWINVAGKPIWNSWVNRMEASGHTSALKILEDTINMAKEFSK